MSLARPVTKQVTLLLSLYTQELWLDTLNIESSFSSYKAQMLTHRIRALNLVGRDQSDRRQPLPLVFFGGSTHLIISNIY